MIQTIKTPNGETLVVLPLAEFEALHEAADAAQHAEALAALARGDEEKLTAEEALALATAATPLAFWRKKRGLTQAKLAEAAEISQSYLAELEGAKRKGDPTLIKRLAMVLRIAMEDLVV